MILSTKVHHSLMVILQAIGGLMSPVVTSKCFPCASPVVFFGIFFLGVMVPRFVFKRFVFGRCPKCGAAATFHGGRPVTYRCIGCKHVHETRIYEGR